MALQIAIRVSAPLSYIHRPKSSGKELLLFTRTQKPHLTVRLLVMCGLGIAGEAEAGFDRLEALAEA